MDSAVSTPLTARRGGPLQGRTRVPGDKSISHRALILGALTVGESTVAGLLEGEDVLHTAEAMRALGARLERGADGLWRTTCFELFLMPEGGEAYCEFNLSPSDRWAAYDFTGYRAGMAERPAEREPQGTMRQGSSFAIFDAAIPLTALPDRECRMNLAAVIEERGGAKSYWAIAHPADKPDFHDPACFAATLPAPGRP